jgi:hypothetical protein
MILNCTGRYGENYSIRTTACRLVPLMQLLSPRGFYSFEVRVEVARKEISKRLLLLAVAANHFAIALNERRPYKPERVRMTKRSLHMASYYNEAGVESADLYDSSYGGTVA